MKRRIVRSAAICFAIVGLVLASQSTAYCQGGPGGGGGGQQGGNQDNGGVEIDATGFLSARALVGNAVLNQQRAAAAKVALNKDLQKPSKLRKVSLTRLEAEVKKLVEAGKPVPEDMLYLAGLNRITHVFYYPETKEIVIAGPAQGYFRGVDNRIIGTEDGQSTLQLEDLIVALRAFGPDGRPTGMISCSIDPTQQGIVNLNQAVSNISSSRTNLNGNEKQIAKYFQNALGNQTVRVSGVSPKTRFARVLVEADYRMKLIGIGIVKPPVPITSFIAKASTRGDNSLTRWYFQPEYDCVTITEDRNALQLSGNGVKLVGEDESISKTGTRKGKGKSSNASRAFTESFTKEYGNLARHSTVFAELRNVIDMSIVAAFIQKMDLYEKADWSMATFADETKTPVKRFNAPTHVAPVINAVWKGAKLMTPIGGGVTIQPRVALNSDKMTIDTEGKIDEVRQSAMAGSEGKWWWD